MAARERSKHRDIYERLHAAILSGKYATGERMPTESELGQHFEASRPTISRALRELERQGLVVRRPGAGTFVRQRRASQSGLLGLTVPHTEGGILAPICQEIIHRAHERGYGVLSCAAIPRGDDDFSHAVADFCDSLVNRDISGVFFLPLISSTGADRVNKRITDRLHHAGVPVVLLDRDICDAPQRSPYDLVGVDNRRNSFIITKHLIDLGCRRIAFVTIGLQVSTSTLRMAGYLEALAVYGLGGAARRIYELADMQDIGLVQQMIDQADADAFVCINDDVARTLMHHLAILGVRVPEDVRVVGFDDLPFAAALPHPLTTMHQPTRAIGAAALDTMLSRIENPQLPARDVMLRCDLIVRTSCGAHLSPPRPAPIAE